MTTTTTMTSAMTNNNKTNNHHNKSNDLQQTSSIHIKHHRLSTIIMPLSSSSSFCRRRTHHHLPVIIFSLMWFTLMSITTTKIITTTTTSTIFCWGFVPPIPKGKPVVATLPPPPTTTTTTTTTIAASTTLYARPEKGTPPNNDMESTTTPKKKKRRGRPPKKLNNKKSSNTTKKKKTKKKMMHTNILDYDYSMDEDQFFHEEVLSKQKTKTLSFPISSCLGVAKDNNNNDNVDSIANARVDANTVADAAVNTITTTNTALCVVPPDKVWDTIQRARHMARDQTYHTWPPAIRLFHPFLPLVKIHDAALKVADLVEQHNIQPFDITLNKLSIVPHWEVLERDDYFWGCGRRSSDAAAAADGEKGDEEEDEDIKEQRKVDELIRNEEEKGRKMHEFRTRYPHLAPGRKPKHLIQKMKEAAAQEQNNKTTATTTTATNISAVFDNENNDASTTLGRRFYNETRRYRASPKQVHAQQKEAFSQFQGPCVVILEPSDESAEKLKELRQILSKSDHENNENGGTKEAATAAATAAADSSASLSSSSSMFEHVQGYSVCTSVSPWVPRDAALPEVIQKKISEGMDTFRPSIAIGSFSTVSEAMKLARTLQSEWKPLTFSVTDLQFLGCHLDMHHLHNDHEEEEISRIRRQRRMQQQRQQQYRGATISDKDRHKNLFLEQHETRELSLRDEESLLLMGSSSLSQYGCDAMVMLMGEEVPAPAQEEASIMDELMDKYGIPGGAAAVDDDNDSALSSLQQQQQTMNGGGGSSSSSSNNMSSRSNKSSNKSRKSEAGDKWEDWLSSEELEYDEGTTIVIGRTHFFTGEMRDFVGMPAASTMDFKDRFMGDSMSGHTRRRNSLPQREDGWKETEYGSIRRVFGAAKQEDASWSSRNGGDWYEP